MMKKDVSRILLVALSATSAMCKKTPPPGPATGSGDEARGAETRGTRPARPAVESPGAVTVPTTAMGFISKDVHAVLVLRNVFQTMKLGTEVLAPIISLVGLDNPLDAIVNEVRTKVGINPFDLKDLARIGIDTSREIVVPMNERGQGFAFVVPITSGEAVHRFLHDSLRKLVEEEAQRNPTVPRVSFAVTKERGFDITTVPGKLGWVVVGSHLVVVPEMSVPVTETLRKMIGFAADKTYAASPDFEKLRATFAKDIDGLLFLGPPFISQWAQRFQREVGGGENDPLNTFVRSVQGAAFGVSLSRERVRIELVAAVPDAERQRIAAAVTRPKALPAMAKRVDPETAAFGAVSINIGSFMQRVFEWRPSVKVEWGNLTRTLKERARLDLDDLVANLNGQVGVSIVDLLPPKAGISASLLGPLAQFAIVAQVGLEKPEVFKTLAKEIERTVEQLAKVAGAKEAPKVVTRRRNIDGISVYSLGKGKDDAFSVALIGDQFVLASGKGRIERIIAIAKGRTKPLADSVATEDGRRRLGRDSLLTAYLSPAQLSKLIPKILAQEGIVESGKGGEMPVIVKALDAFSGVHLDVTAEAPGLRADLSVGIRPPAGKK